MFNFHLSLQLRFGSWQFFFLQRTFSIFSPTDHSSFVSFYKTCMFWQVWTGIQSGGSNVVTEDTKDEENDDDAGAGPSGVVDTGVTKPLEPAFEKPTEPIDIFPGKIEKLLNSISKVCQMSISWIGHSENIHFRFPSCFHQDTNVYDQASIIVVFSARLLTVPLPPHIPREDTNLF